MKEAIGLFLCLTVLIALWPDSERTDELPTVLEEYQTKRLKEIFLADPDREIDMYEVERLDNLN